MRQVRTLRWRASPAPQVEWPPWLRWLRWLRRPISWLVHALSWVAGGFAWLAQTARVLLWAVAAVLAALLVVYLLRLVRSGRDSRSTRMRAAPTHVRDLDIRPQNLPADIGGAARTLWDGGDRREALALLYRGLLSRLAHVHGAAIRDSSTEGDCLEQASRHLDAERAAYAARLVGTWQRAVYGGAAVDTSVAHALCAEFADALDERASVGALAAAAASGASA
jgi:hypothetical protein